MFGKKVTEHRLVWLSLVVSFVLVGWANLPKPIATGDGSASKTVTKEDDLAAACREMADWVASRLGTGCGVIVRVPFVIGGDLSDAELARWYRQVISPAARAMAAEYLVAEPSEPITILLFHREPTYRRHAKRLFGDREVSRFGYYRPHLRTLLINISTGERVLLHELTHALVAFDFPNLPAWFGEGLAALHERCRIKPDASGIVGEVNWRLPILEEAIRQNRLRPLESLLKTDDFRGRRARLNYAHARYFCLYLQRLGILGEFYHRFRTSADLDPTGCRTLRELFPARTGKELDDDFRRFVIGLKKGNECL